MVELTQPLAHNLLRQLETPEVARLHVSEFWGRGFDVFSPEPDLTLDQIAALYGPAYETTAPDQHTERVQYFDHVKRHRNIRLGPEQPVATMEIVRASVPGEAVGVVETIATWLRLRALADAGPQDFEIYDGTIAAPVVGVGTPFPWPFPHPDGGSLEVEWLLVRERVADVAPQPAFAGFAPGQAAIPRDTALTVPWRDQRYNWNGNHSSDHYFVTGDRSFLRLFATFFVTGPGLWSVEIAGRLGGFFQLTGYRRAGLSAALTRS